MRLTIAASFIAALFVTSALAAGDTGVGKGVGGLKAKATPPPPPAVAAPPVAGVLIIHHRVADYAKWRPVFVGDKARQEAAGLTNPDVYQGKNPNDVFIIYDMADEAKAKAFAASKGLRDAMKKAGVAGKPDIMFLTPEK